MERQKTDIGGTQEKTHKTAKSSQTGSSKQEKNLVNPDHKYVGSYLRWLGDQLEKENTENHRSPPPHHSKTHSHVKVARDLAWVGDELESRRSNEESVSNFVGDFPPCCVVIFGILCYVVVCGNRRIR